MRDFYYPFTVVKSLVGVICGFFFPVVPLKRLYVKDVLQQSLVWQIQLILNQLHHEGSRDWDYWEPLSVQGADHSTENRGWPPSLRDDKQKGDARVRYLEDAQP